MNFYYLLRRSQFFFLSFVLCWQKRERKNCVGRSILAVTFSSFCFCRRVEIIVDKQQLVFVNTHIYIFGAQSSVRCAWWKQMVAPDDVRVANVGRCYIQTNDLFFFFCSLSNLKLTWLRLFTSNENFFILSILSALLVDHRFFFFVVHCGSQSANIDLVENQKF